MRIKNVLHFLVLFVLVFGLTSCASRVLEEKTQTKIGFMPITDHLILGIAKEHDNANYTHLNLETVKFSDWATLAESLRSGSLDGAILLAPLAFQVKLAGAPVKVTMLTHRDGSALVVAVNEGINSVQDLRGKTIAIPHRFSTHNMLLHMYTTAAGLAYGKDFQTVEMAPSEMVSALATHKIDGYIVAEPFGAKGEILGVGKVLVLSNKIWEHHPDCILVMREEYLNEHPEAMDELALSLINAGIFAEQNREQAAEIGEKFLGHPKNVLLKSLTDPKERVTFYDLLPNLGEFTQLQNYMADNMGLFPKKVNMSELVDTSFAERAYSVLGNDTRQAEYQPRK